MFIINIDVWGAKMDLNVKDLLRLSDPISAICSVASMAMFFIVVLFSFTTKDRKRARRFYTVPLHRIHRKKSKTTLDQPRDSSSSEQSHNL
jgi:hypothetical protein